MYGLQNEFSIHCIKSVSKDTKTVCFFNKSSYTLISHLQSGCSATSSRCSLPVIEKASKSLLCAQESDESMFGAHINAQYCFNLFCSGSEPLNRELWTRGLAHFRFALPPGKSSSLQLSFTPLNKQFISLCHFLINPSFADFIPLFDIYGIISLALSNFDSNFVKQLPFLLSVVFYHFSFGCLASDATGQCGLSAYTLLLFVFWSILQFLMLLSCQKHCKTAWTICTSTLTHTCLYHLSLQQ